MEADIQQQQQPSARKSTGKDSAESKNTRVILVCINNNSGYTITNDFLYAIFSPYGKVLRILIFEKLKILKAFVEYSTIEAAIEAKKLLSNYLLLNDGTRISIYNSNLETIKFQSNNTGGVDYTLLENKPSNNVNEWPQRAPDDHSTTLSHFHQAIDGLNPSNIQINHESHENMHNEINGSDSHQKGDNLPDDEEEKTNTQQIREEEADSENFLAFLQSGFTNTKAQITHVHSVPAQLYRDNPQLQNQPQEQQPKRQAPNNSNENSLPPGLQISQINQQQPQGGFQMQPGNPQLIRNAMSMNFIPYTEPNKQIPNLMRHPTAGELPTLQQQPMQPTLQPIMQPMGGPINQFPQFASMNTLPMPMSGNYTPTQRQDFNQFGQPIQRPQLNPRSFSQPDLSLMGLNPQDQLQRNPQGIPGLEQLVLNRDYNLPLPNQGGGAPPGLTMDVIANANNPLLKLHNNLSVLLGKGDLNKKSRVLYVKGLENKEVKVQMLYNIFSNFGNISKILFIPTKSSALIEFETAEYSTICMDYLNNISFLGKPLRIFYSKYPTINIKSKKGDEPEGETFVGSHKTSRFKNNKAISINPPSSTLHLSNLVKESCTEDTIRTLFSPYGRIEALKFIFGENNKNMCLIRLSSIEESLNSMAYLHDSDISGRKVQISFTRSRI